MIQFDEHVFPNYENQQLEYVSYIIEANDSNDSLDLTPSKSGIHEGVPKPRKNDSWFCLASWMRVPAQDIYNLQVPVNPNCWC